jgi:hypothetical protein
MGHLFRGLRRHQNHLRGGSAWSSSSHTPARIEIWDSCAQGGRQRKREGDISSRSTERLPTGGEGTPLGAAYNVRDDRWGDEHDVYEPSLGHQDEVHGASCFQLFWGPRLTVPLLPPIQTQTWDEPRYLHTLDAARTIYRSEGIKAFYRGLLPSLLGIAHVAVQFPLYEQLKMWSRESVAQYFHGAHDAERCCT